MTRIIPELLNKKLKKEYHLRFFTLLFFILSLGIVINIAFVSSSYLLLHLYEKAYTQNTTKDNNENIKLNEDFNQKIEDLYLLSKKINSSESVSQVEIVKLVFSHVGEGISIQALEITEDFKITLRGVAQSRDDLIVLQENFQKDSYFVDFSVPIETLAKQKDITFNVTFAYHEN